jgi:hypothetical protein
MAARAARANARVKDRFYTETILAEIESAIDKEVKKVMVAFEEWDGTVEEARSLSVTPKSRVI